MRLPDDTQRTAVIGRTGSGKTRAGVWLLSTQNIKSMPWIIIDFKGEALFNQLDAKVIKVTAKVPDRPGLYIIHLLPHEIDKLEDFMWRCHSHEHVGLFIDEGAMLGDSRAFRALLSQGRSKHIPMIILSQRPVRMSISVFSEADFFMVFHLNYSKDHQRIVEYIGDQHKSIVNEALPEYCSLWYDVGRDELSKLLPVPPDEILVRKLKAQKTGRDIQQRVSV